ncbi:hypothetical protein B0H13DRAFT_2539510 [Mycena leptocephala]|nr:hypothetical protein B0H13DRAFT_2539510 [Mycena leptocephala]
MQLGQFSAVITVDGLPLSEYAVEYSADGTEATCWIASENDFIAGEEPGTLAQRFVSHILLCFLVEILYQAQGYGFLATTYNFWSNLGRWHQVRRPAPGGQGKASYDDAYLNAAISPELGTIKAVCDLVRPRHGGGTTRRNWHEGIAPPAPRVQRAATPTDVVDLSMDVDEDDGDDAEIRKLETRLNALKKKNKGKQVKRESSNVKKEIKSEEPIFRPGEVIDLT